MSVFESILIATLVNLAASFIFYSIQKSLDRLRDQIPQVVVLVGPGLLVIAIIMVVFSNLVSDLSVFQGSAIPFWLAITSSILVSTLSLFYEIVFVWLGKESIPMFIIISNNLAAFGIGIYKLANFGFLERNLTKVSILSILVFFITLINVIVIASPHFVFDSSVHRQRHEWEAFQKVYRNIYIALIFLSLIGLTYIIWL